VLDGPIWYYAITMELSMSARRAVTQKQALAYRNGSKSEKSRILDQLTGSSPPESEEPSNL
jgi:hypothetical protein